MESTSRRSAFALFAVMLAACASTADDEKSSKQARANVGNKSPDGTIQEIPVRCPW